MMWAIVALLLIMGFVGVMTSSELVGGVIQIILICALVVLGIRRILRSKVE
ncbi:MAG: lmo0937 family membrane protein [Candidatus Binatia bacterium]